MRSVDLLKSLRRLYSAVLLETLRGLRLNLSHYFVHAAALCAAGSLLAVFRTIPGLAGALLSGVAFGAFLSLYLASVSAAVHLEAVSARECVARASALFPRVMGVLFIFFVLTLGIHFAVRSSLWLVLANLIMAVMWNSILETTYLEEENGWENFRSSWRFVYENTLEWFLPIVAVAALVSAALGAAFATRMLVLFLATHPLQFLQMLLSGAGRPEILLRAWLPCTLFLLFLYPAFIFRGILYKHLSRSNRRKRIFDAQF